MAWQIRSTGPMADGLHALTRLASAQYGCFTRGQWRTCGLTDARLDRALASGWVVRVLQRVFRLAGTPVSWGQRLRAATLLSPGRVFVGGRSALALRGLADTHDPRPHVTIDHGLRFRFDRRELVIHSSRTLHLDDPDTVKDIPTVSVARSLFEDGMTGPDWSWRDTVSEAARRRLVTMGELAETLQLMGRIPHARAMKRTLSTLDDRVVDARSVPEVSLLHVVEEVTGRRGVLNHPVTDPSGLVVARVDVAVPDAHFGIEGDSARFHGAGARQDADRRRDLEFRELGWEVGRVMLAWLRSDPERVRRVVRATWADAQRRAA